MIRRMTFRTALAWTAGATLVLAATLRAGASDTTPTPARRTTRLEYPELLATHLRQASPAMRPRTHDAAKRVDGSPTYLVPQRLDPLVTGDGSIGDRLGATLAVSGNVVLVGAPFDTVVRAGAYGGVVSGTVAVLTHDTAGWKRDAVFTAAQAGNSGQFGGAIAFDCSVAVVGAPFESPNNEIARGAAWVFRRNGATWTEEAMLEAPAPAPGDRFGSAVAVSADRIVIAAPRRDVGGVADAGAAFVFERIGAVWTLVSTLALAAPVADDRVGNAVALDGDLALAGAPGLDVPGEPANRGAVIPFVRDVSGNWIGGAAIGPTGLSQDAQFGFTLSLSADTLAVGAPTDAAGGTSGRGSATLYPRVGATSFGAPQIVVAPDGVQGDEFGFSLALDGARLLAGAPDHGNGEGAAYVFTRVVGTWTFDAKVSSPNGPFADVSGFAVAWLNGDALLGAPLVDRPPNRAQGELRRYAQASSWALADAFDSGDGAAAELFGFSVAVDRGTVVVGSHRDDTVGGSDDAGSASVFRRGTSGWERVARLVAADGESEDLFGIAVAVHGDVIAVGAYQDIVGFQINQGSVYIFERQQGAWTQTVQLLAPDGQGDDFLGFSVAYDGTRLIAGAPGDDDVAVNAGAAYVWRRERAGWVLEEKLVIAGSTAESFGGISVAIRDDLALVGAPQADIGADPFAGRVAAFVRGSGAWQQLQEFTAPGVAAFDFFGGALATDGTRIAVGAPGDSSGQDQDEIVGHGSVWTFTRSDAGVIPEQQIIAPTLEAGAGLGVSVAISGQRLVAGASGTDGAMLDTGAASVYRRDVGGWTPVQSLAPADAAEFEFFGRAVALDAVNLVVGAPERSRDNPREGAAYVYDDADRLLTDSFE